MCVPLLQFNVGGTFCWVKLLADAMDHDEERGESNVDDCRDGDCAQENENVDLVAVVGEHYGFPEMDREEEQPGCQSGEWTAVLHVELEATFSGRRLLATLAVDSESA